MDKRYYLITKRVKISDTSLGRLIWRLIYDGFLLKRHLWRKKNLFRTFLEL
jgi:hypothetical protein